MSGPVSQALEADLREQARQHGVVVWLDKEGTYTTFADALSERAADGEFAIPVRRFRGSYLEVMLALEGIADSITKTPLIVHVPGHTEESIAQTPLFEIYAAGRRYRRALATAVREAALGLATPETTEAFLAGDVTMEAADAWLIGLRDARDGRERDLSPFSPDALFDALLPTGSLAAEAGDPALARSVRRRAAATLGVAETWWSEYARNDASDLSTPLAGWALCVEFVHDLRRLPNDERLGALKALPRPAVAACQKLAAHARKRHPDVYARIADEYEIELEQEASSASAADLGKIDTFRFEDRVVLVAALDALDGAKFEVAYEYAIERTAEDSFWPTYVRGRQIAWQLVKLAAQLGRALTASALLLDDVRNVGEAIERYTNAGYVVDTAHRELEQARHQLAHLEIEEVTTLRKRLDALRGAYRAWADGVAGTFNALCRAEGFLPAAELQQRTLFDDVVAPAAKQAPTAYFMVDGLRFEMGKQLAQSLDSKTADVVVKARLAELPTVTEVGMNVLAPLAREGKLQPDINERGEIRGFRSSEARISVPDDRRKAIHERVGGKTCPRLSLEEVLDRDVTKLRRAIAEARLVIVHCEGIDKSGEKGVGLSVFERELQYLRSAWRQLFEAGVRRFVFAADHGFLIHDPITRAPIVHGFKTVPKRRHVVSFDHLDRPEEVAIDAASLGYETSRGTWFLVPETTAPFDVGDRAKDFVHGGNSLQERVIPVLTVIHKHAAGTSTARFAVEAKALKPVARMHCVELRVTASGQTGLAFGSAKEIELVIECIDGAGVQAQVCDARDARLTGAGVIATVDQRCEVYFRLTGPRDERVRIQVRQAGGGANVDSCSLVERFEVERTQPATVAPTSPSFENKDAWLNEMPAGGIRDVFRHISVHGSVNEAEATQMLGGARAFRKFSRELDEHAKLAPFKVRVSVVSGTKCYVRGD